MKRLTMWYDGNQAICEDETCVSDCCPFADPVCDRVQLIIDRLAAIEDILGDDYDLDRLRELVEADQEKRCVVLPFRPPKTVYSCSKHFPKPEQAHYASEINIMWDMDRGCVFGDTPEATEAALEAREQDG